MLSRKTMKVYGMDRAEKVVKTIQQIPYAYKGAEYRGGTDDKGVQSYEKLNWLADRTDKNWDFRGVTKEQGDKMARILAKELERRMNREGGLKAVKGGTGMMSRATKIGRGKAKRLARKVSGPAYRKAMKYWIKVKGKDLDDGRTASGDPPNQVDSEYAGLRAVEYGMPDDPTIVGIASGKLLADMNVSAAAGQIRLLE